MNWIPWSEGIKKRACRYLLQRYLGQYLQEKLTMDQLSVDLYKGTGTITELNLDVDALNEMADTYNLPIEFVDGYIQSISVSIPWSSLLNANSFVEINGLMMTIQPKQRSGSASLMNSLLESMAMTTSMELAKECLRQEQDSEKDTEAARPLEGLEIFAQTIDSVLCRIKIRFIDTIFRLEHVPKGSKTGVALEIRVKKIDYFDAAGVENSTISNEELQRNIYEPVAFTCKTFHWEGVMLYTDEFPFKARTFSKSVCSFESSPDAKVTDSYTTAPDTPEFHLQQPVFESCINNMDDSVAQTIHSLSNLATQPDPILISKLSGGHEIRLKLKQRERIPGPKVSLDFSVGSVVSFLSPRQVHILSELLSGLTSPGIEDDSNVARRYTSTSKPMQASDFERVEQELQKQLVPHCQGRSLQHQQGWSSQSLDDSDEEFLPVVGLGNHMTTSTASDATSQFSDGESVVSSTSRSTPINVAGLTHPLNQMKNFGKSKGHPYQDIYGHAKSKRHSAAGTMSLLIDDPMAETTYFKLQLSSLVIIILHEDVLTPSAAGSGFVAHSSVMQMKAQADKFFNELGVFSVSGCSERDLKSAHDRLSAVCKANHLRFIGAPCTIEGNDKTSSVMKSFTVTLSFGTCEFVECLFDKKSPPCEPVPEYCKLLSFPTVSKGESKLNTSFFHGTSNLGIAQPCLKLRINHWESLATQSSRPRIAGPPRTELQFHLTPCESEIDISIVDRIACLLNPQELCGVVSHSPPIQINGQGYITQAVEDGSSNSDHKLDFSVISSFVLLHIMFPVPDLRPLHDMDRVPWWKRAIRKDMLILELTEARIHTILDEISSCWSLDIRCKDLHGLFQESPTDLPISFLRASPGNSDNSHIDEDEGFDWPRLNLKVCPPVPLLALEEQEAEDSDDANHGSSIDTLVHQLCTSEATELSPFSTRKIIYESEHSSRTEYSSAESKKSGSSPDGEQMVLPGDRREVEEFIERSTNNSQYIIELSLANLNVVLPSKHFFEVLYNRLCTDLLMWESAAPRPVTKDSSFIRPAPVNPNWANSYIQDTAYQPFSMCKSAIRYDSSCESDEESSPQYCYFDECKQKQKKYINHNHISQNKICVTINTKQAAVTLYTPLRDAHGKVVPEHRGEIQLHVIDGTFFAVSKAHGAPTSGFMCLHANRVTFYHKGVLSSDPLESLVVQATDLSPPKHLHSTLYGSEKGTCIKVPDSDRIDGDSTDMLMLAVRINLDTMRNVKTFRVALGINGATLRHRMCVGPESWFKQFVDFFDVVDYPIMGYKPPEVMTELHLHTWSCAVDYRPRYLPVRAFLTMETFSVCSNIAAQTSTSVVRIIIEDACLFLSKKLKAPVVDLRHDYVCVIDMSFFELSLRCADGKDMRQPKTDLRASSNSIHIRTCVDSCCALQDILCYFASDGDLKDENATIDIGDEDGGPSSLQSDASTLTNLEEEHVHSLMAEAMKESSCSADCEDTEVDYTSPEIQQLPSEVFLFPDETCQFPQQPLSISPVAANGAPSFVEPAAPVFSEDSSDDDFCILENDPGVGIVPKTGEPQIRLLASEPLRVIENHFTVPFGRMDQLKAPKQFPRPVVRYTLQEISLTWHLYGGEDFLDESKSGKEGTRKTNTTECNDADFDPEYFGSNYPSLNRMSSLNAHDIRSVGISFTKSNQGEVHWKSSPSSRLRSPSSGATKMMWQVKGGPGRLHDQLMELQMNKVRFQYEKYPESTPQASRQILLIHEVEIRDRLASSQINKFLYLYSSESMPRQSHANMVVIKALHLRPDPSVSTQECALKVSFLPLRLNIDQDALFFLYNFFGSLSGSKENANNIEHSRTRGGIAFNGSSKHHKNGPCSLDSIKSTPTKLSTHSVPVMTVNTSSPSSFTDVQSEDVNSDSQNLLIVFDERELNSLDCADTVSLQSESDAAGESSSVSSPIFFRSFLFSPDVPIRLDYHGKWVDMEQGALAGLIIGLGQLNSSELCLKRISYRHGLLGVDRLLSHVLNEWLQDIRHRQLPSLLGSVGPLHSFVQLFQGVRDLFWLPIEQYRKDGRIVRGLQRGANAFTTSTAMAALELANRLVQAVQCTAETAYDVVSPGPSVRKQGTAGQQRRKKPMQPADIREGMANAYQVVREGLGDTARTLVQVASEEHEHKGISGAVGGVLRQIPSTVVKPIILATEATSNVLGGMRHQLAPDVRREAAEKWRVQD